MDGQKFAAGLYLLSLYPLECKDVKTCVVEMGEFILLSGIISVIGWEVWVGVRQFGCKGWKNLNWSPGIP